MSNDTMTDVFDIMDPDGVLDAQTISGLRSMFGERLVSEIGAMGPRQLAREIVSRREQHGLGATPPAATVAVALLDFMRKMEFITPAPTAASLPTSITLVQDKTPQNMNLRELLTELVKDPSRYDELVQYINALPEIQRASRKSPNWAVTVAGRKDTLDVDATLTRVSILVKHTIVQNRLPDGRYPTLLARIFGQEERFMLNPFATSLDEAALRGPIFGEFDPLNLDEKIHLAYIWAAFVADQGRGHQLWPKQIDLFTELPQAFAQEPAGRYAVIVSDFEAAKNSGDPSTEGLTRYITPQDLRSRRPFGGSPSQERDPAWYQAQLREYCGREISVSHGSDSASCCVVPYVRVASGSARLDRVISLGDITVTSGDISGTAWAPQGARVRAASGSISHSIQTLSWKRLYEKAVELGIIER